MAWLLSQAHPPAVTTNQQKGVEGSDTAPSEKCCQVQPTETFGERLTADPVAFFTMLLAFITGGLAIYTGLLWRSTSKLVEGADQTSKQELRAYLSIKEAQIFACTPAGERIEPLRTISQGTRPSSELKIINAGQTPASDVRLVGTMAMVDWPLDEALLQTFPLPTEGSRSILGPGGESSKYDTIPDFAPVLTASDMQRLVEGKIAIVVFGTVFYRDIFGQQRWTRYRYFTGGPVSLRALHMSPHGEGNEADYSH